MQAFGWFFTLLAWVSLAIYVFAKPILRRAWHTKWGRQGKLVLVVYGDAIQRKPDAYFRYPLDVDWYRRRVKDQFLPRLEPYAVFWDRSRQSWWHRLTSLESLVFHKFGGGSPICLIYLPREGDVVSMGFGGYGEVSPPYERLDRLVREIQRVNG